MVICQTGTSVDEVFTNWKPESTPVTAPAASVMLEQGAAKVDWVTVWFLSRNWNWTTSPSATPVSLHRENAEKDVRIGRAITEKRGGDALVGGVDEVAAPADLDDVSRGVGSTDGQESGSNSGETHLELGREGETTSGRKFRISWQGRSNRLETAIVIVSGGHTKRRKGDDVPCSWCAGSKED